MTNTLFVAWRSGGPANGRWGPVGRLDHRASGYRFVYTRGAKSMENFIAFPGMPDLNAVYESEELFPLFANRLLARSRPEYEAFLLWGAFDPENPPDPIAVLSVTEGRRATDSLEVFPGPRRSADGHYLNKFFLHGMRWMEHDAVERIDKLHRNERLHLKPEPANVYDAYAVAVFAAGANGQVKIGYVPRYLACDVSELISSREDNVVLTVERVNPNAPLQQRVLCNLQTCWPDGFRPCSGDEFQPVVGELSATAT